MAIKSQFTAGIYKILKSYWGYDTLYPDQEKIINHILEGKNTISLIPTGGGKSLCFQIPAMMIDGVCLVISPLIALIEDQIKRLQKIGIPAERLHSNMDKEKQNDVISSFLDQKFKLLYLSPERLQSEKFKPILLQAHISFVAIDEAHCISQWGYDFRPEYRKIKYIKTIFPNTQICAFTATANYSTIADIETYLDIRNNELIRSSFLKKNINFGVINTSNKFKLLTKLLNEFKGSGIIYMRSRNGTESLSYQLNQYGFDTLYYHAGMSSLERSQIQEKWINNESKIIISTTAFGMGIDKPDVRFVIHVDLPTSMEEYYQEAGRAGRDRLPSDAVIIYNEKDVLIFKKRSIENFPTFEDIKLTYNNLKKFLLINEFDENQYFLVNLDDFVVFNTLPKIKTFNALMELDRLNQISVNSNPERTFNHVKILNYTDDKEFFENLEKPESDIIKYLISKNVNVHFYKSRMNDSNIMEELKLTEKDYYSTLASLKRKNKISWENKESDFIINYLPEKKFTVEEDELKYRKMRMEKNFEIINSYIHLESCRQKFILEYFNEILKSNCGNCDFCSGYFSTKYSEKEFGNFTDKIFDLLKERPGILEDLIYIDKYIERLKNKSMLKKMVDLGVIELVGDKVMLRQSGI